MKRRFTANSTDEFLRESYEKWARRSYVWTKVQGVYEPRTFGELIGDAWALAAALIAAGHKGKQVMIFSENSYEWMVTDLAVMAYAGVSIGANKDWLEHDMQAVLGVVDSAVLVYSRARAEVVAKLRPKHRHITYVCIEDEWQKLVAEGREILSKEPQYLKSHAQPSAATCKIVFTSGSTAEPKAVMLTMDNMMATGDGLWARTPTCEDDVYYLFLPLHHVYAGVSIFLCSLYVGAQVYLSANVKEMEAELREVRPTVFCAVPLVFERFYKAIDEATMARIRKGIRLSKRCLRLDLDIRSLVFRRLYEVFGGRIKYMFCGGAHFDPMIKGFFKDVGLNLIEGYGMTETSAIIAMEYPHSRALEAVGTVLENMSVKIVNADDVGYGEIAVKGGNVTSGYYNNPEANKRAFDQNGYFHTGDMGYLDKGRNLCVLGRKRRVIKTSNAENVSPDELEGLLTAHCPALAKARVYQEHNTICATLYAGKGKTIDSHKLIREVNALLPKYKHIHEYFTETIDPATLMK